MLSFDAFSGICGGCLFDDVLASIREATSAVVASTD